MSRFVDKQIQRFDLGGGDWVDLVTRLSYLDRSNIEQKLIGASVAAKPVADPDRPAQEMSGDAKEQARAGVKDEVEIAMAAVNLELLKRTIYAWGGPGFTMPDGQVAQINEGTIGRLDETAEKILAELQRRLVKPKPGFTPPPLPHTPTAGAEESTEAS